MKSCGLQLNERRMLSLMKTIADGKVVHINSFLESIGIHVSTYNKKLGIIKEKYPIIYNDYKTNVEVNKKIYEERSKVIISIMEDMLENGIELEDGSVRTFDLLDWYCIKEKYFKNCPRTEMMKLIEKRDEERAYTETRATKTRKLITDSYINNFGCSDTVITFKHIEKDNTYNLSEKEKKAIIQFFCQNGIPFTNNTFKCASERIKGNLKVKERIKNSNEILAINYFGTKKRIRL